MLKRTARLALAALALTLAACAGSPFKWDDARKIQPGMTPTEVSQLLGPPTAVRASGETVSYVWAYVSSVSGSRTLRVDFKDGHVIKAPPIPPELRD
ncbi:hypothetical protein GCM10007933_02580 [Zoogloea oryzae]|uniref:Outer membrane protein assembly factor BamE domain-containing protein n=1 Tax=Zoogloea oryzae TaxID=310767 RepID=A0ABQ6F7M9_9RHOO|nr:outer membrane protein assembly factor BamE [Zoogloea oryzae]GLT20806.1 hypothetical protein GCM10007933_02580 [Zoogloea oryzae]